MAPKCGICHEMESKYRCPVLKCQLRYCSLACYKVHKSTHDGETGSAATGEAQPQMRDRPGTIQRFPKVDFTGFENDQDFIKLLARYPLLKVQLQAIYGLTLEPGPDEARTWNRQPLPGLNSSRPGPRRGRRRGRGRGEFARGSGRGGHTSMESSMSQREHGQWTQVKGDKEALSVIKKMREEGGENVDASEGMREFVELCRIRFTAKVSE